MLKTLIKTSSFVQLLEKVCIIYSSIELRLLKIYKNSQAHRLIQNFKERIKVFFKYSFLGRIAEVKEEENSLVLTESRVLVYMINAYKKYRNKARQCLITSRNYILVGQTQRSLYSSPLRTIGIILAVAVFTNIIFSLLFGKKIELIGWVMRGLLLFAGTSGLNSRIDWPTVRENSAILRLISRRKCAGFAER